MTLSPGQKLSFYEVLGLLGAGGMGEVYRARDTRLDREVAIKVLPDELANDEDRLLRFEREAKTLAALNHPNVGSIYGVDQAEGRTFFALELVPGETLGERLAHGPRVVRKLDRALLPRLTTPPECVHDARTPPPSINAARAPACLSS